MRYDPKTMNRSGVYIYNSVTIVSGGVTGGFGWVQTHPLSKKAPMKSHFRKSEDFFWGVGGGGGVGLRKKKHELCQSVLNKQQHLHDALIAFNFDH